MSNPNNTGMFPKSAWMDIWDRAYYSVTVGELERELLTVGDESYEWNKRKKQSIQEQLAEHRALLSAARQALKPYMRRKMVKGGAA